MAASSEAKYEVCEMKIGPGCFIRITVSGAVPKHVYSFADEPEARAWIKQQDRDARNSTR
ncbi:hypothetical protein SAMN05443248_0285 [Bradyrhizobium erythrophlei]|uniref:Uncharacterized protein n=1 Tax=Bradyrhizobium erythrophlei TaxID=1437360 RepID=A0A1M5H2D9_9BRAD|nr:hypothetical protein SAMN05443248_0285 [Bradyrhizobium erythrophlei]